MNLVLFIMESFTYSDPPLSPWQVSMCPWRSPAHIWAFQFLELRGRTFLHRDSSYTVTLAFFNVWLDVPYWLVVPQPTIQADRFGLVLGYDKRPTCPSGRQAICAYSLSSTSSFSFRIAKSFTIFTSSYSSCFKNRKKRLKKVFFSYFGFGGLLQFTFISLETEYSLAGSEFISLLLWTPTYTWNIDSLVG